MSRLDPDAPIMSRLDPFCSCLPSCEATFVKSSPGVRRTLGPGALISTSKETPKWADHLSGNGHPVAAAVPGEQQAASPRTQECDLNPWDGDTKVQHPFQIERTAQRVSHGESQKRVREVQNCHEETDERDASQTTENTQKTASVSNHQSTGSGIWNVTRTTLTASTMYDTKYRDTSTTVNRVAPLVERSSHMHDRGTCGQVRENPCTLEDEMRPGGRRQVGVWSAY